MKQAFKNSWWSREWWLDFVITPMAEKFGLVAVHDMPVAEAYVYSDSLSSRGDIEAYHMWKIDQKHKQREKGRGKASGEDTAYMTTLMPSEQDPSKIKNAMASAQNYLGLMNSRGMNSYKEKVVGTIR